ncbi:MAG TPA: hypothetical protein VFD32_04760 [Dehalococcoidia bacterium]|nr:hypothetical protein [Dehalococcoidia bacterium]
MATISRRKLLARTGLGAAAAGVVTAVPGLLVSHHGSRAATLASNQLSHSASGGGAAAGAEVPSVAYVRDAKKGEVVLMVGTREVVHTDPALVAYLTRAYNNASA